MGNVVIRVENVSKRYRLGEIGGGSLREDLHRWWARVRGEGDPYRAVDDMTPEGDRDSHHWALRDVSFDISQGDIAGEIGRNGAGKSTLLKLLSRITAPTTGTLKIRGRVGSLLEVGTGFHPELTGRENIYLNGAILGMRKAEIDARLDEIVAFSELERFIDTPVKRYSSGMYVRLAFAVAAHLNSEILIVDEVLAVGDAEFQRKCIGKLEDTHAEGRTVLVVSHNMQVISQLCRTALWLDMGMVVQHGTVQEVSTAFLAVRRVRTSEWIPTDQASHGWRYERVSVIAPRGSTPESIAASQPFSIEFRYTVLDAGLRGRIALQIRNQHDQPILSSASTDGSSVRRKEMPPGSYIETCEIPGHFLAPGTYFLTISQPAIDGDIVIENICTFTIDSADSLAGIDGRAGFVAPQLRWFASE